jgi:hypothetical protein
MNHKQTLSSRPEQIIAKAMTCGVEGYCVSLYISEG